MWRNRWPYLHGVFEMCLIMEYLSPLHIKHLWEVDEDKYLHRPETNVNPSPGLYTVLGHTLDMGKQPSELIEYPAHVGSESHAVLQACCVADAPVTTNEEMRVEVEAGHIPFIDIAAPASKKQ